MTRLKRQAAKNAAGHAALEQLVLKAHDQGKSLRDIAAAVKMTPEGVRKMLVRVALQAAERELDEIQAELNALGDA